MLMLACHYRPPKLCVAFALIISTTASLATAAHSGDGPRRLYTANQFAPIGKLFSLGAVMIDGRALSGEQSLWGGEQVWAKEAGATVQLGSVGRVLLYRGSLARLSLDVPAEGAAIAEPVLTVVLAAGEVAVSLEAAAGARLVVGETIYRASRGAQFKVRTADRERPFDLKAGVITRETSPQHPRYDVGPVITDRLGRDIGKAPQKRQVRKQARTQMAVKLQEADSANPPRKTAFMAYQLQTSEQPAKGVVAVKVMFCLEKPIGVFLPGNGLCQVVESNQYGVAVVEFQAGSNADTSRVTANVLPPSEGSWTGEIEVVGLVPWKKVAILAAVTGGVICVFKCRRHSTPPLRQAPSSNTP